MQAMRTLFNIYRGWLLIGCIFPMATCRAQEGITSAAQPELPVGWRFPLELHQGCVQEGTFYAGGLTLGALRTVVPGHLRLGLVAGPAVVSGRFHGHGGVRAAWRVKTFTTALGSWGNLQLAGEHLWYTDGVALVGGGPVVEAGELVLVGLKGYWPYQTDSDQHPGYFFFSIGLNILKGKPAPADNDPFTNP